MAGQSDSFHIQRPTSGHRAAGRLALKAVNYERMAFGSSVECEVEVENLSAEPIEGLDAVVSYFDEDGRFVTSDHSLPTQEPLRPGHRTRLSILSTWDPAIVASDIHFRGTHGNPIDYRDDSAEDEPSSAASSRAVIWDGLLFSSAASSTSRSGTGSHTPLVNPQQTSDPETGDAPPPPPQGPVQSDGARMPWHDGGGVGRDRTPKDSSAALWVGAWLRRIGWVGILGIVVMGVIYREVTMNEQPAPPLPAPTPTGPPPPPPPAPPRPRP